MLKNKYLSGLVDFFVSHRIGAGFIFGVIGILCVIYFLSASLAGLGLSTFVHDILIFLLGCAGFGLGIGTFVTGVGLIGRLAKYLENSAEAAAKEFSPNEYEESPPAEFPGTRPDRRPDNYRYGAPEVREADETREETTEVYEPVRKKSGNRLPVYAFAASLCLLILAMPAIYVFFLRSETDNQGSKKEDETEKNIKQLIDRKPEEYRKSLWKYREDPDIGMIFRDNLESKRVGGAIAVAITNWQYNHDKDFETPEQLGFRRITGENSLVELVINNKVVIKDIIISKRRESHQFDVKIILFNLTEEKLEYFIPKGQVIEMKDALLVEYIKNAKAAPPVARPQPDGINKNERPQSGASKEGKRENIPPMEESEVNFIAFCINQGLANPKGQANLTIYELIETLYETPERLYDLINGRNKTSI
jgi:hypothetical protein